MNLSKEDLKSGLGKKAIQKRKSLFRTLSIILFCFLFSGCFLGNLPFFNRQLERPHVLVEAIEADSVGISFYSDNADEYKIIYSSAHEEFEFVEVTSYNYITLNTLYWDEKYTVKVQAISLSSDYKDSEFVCTSFKTKDRVIPEGDLREPENFKAQLSFDKSSVILTWAPVENAAFYDIDCSYLVYLQKTKGVFF